MSTKYLSIHIISKKDCKLYKYYVYFFSFQFWDFIKLLQYNNIDIDINIDGTEKLLATEVVYLLTSHSFYVYN